jgi:hypothetical protein
MKSSQGLKSQVDIIALVPLINTNRQWVPARGATIFFPTCRGIEIPRDLPLSLVDPSRLGTPKMVELFKVLGVSQCQPERIFPLIKSACKSSQWTRQNALEHLKFIYWNYDELDEDERQNPTMIVIDNNKKKWPHNDIGWIYHAKSKHDEAYHALNIINRPVPAELENSMQFLNPMYYDYFETCENRHNESGIAWLEEFLDLQSTPRIRKRGDQQKLSPEINHIVHHRPEKLLGVLESDWPFRGPDRAWLKEFRALNARVPISIFEDKMPLSETYLPLPKLKAIVSRLGLHNDFGFLEELKEMNFGLTTLRWIFLQDLGVGIEENLRFWIHLLKNARKENNVDVKVTAEIYTNMQRFCTDETDRTVLKYGHSFSCEVYHILIGTGRCLKRRMPIMFCFQKFGRTGIAACGRHQNGIPFTNLYRPKRSTATWIIFSGMFSVFLQNLRYMTTSIS